jgi:NAD(P)-dependent dehydrogenase (short-subunit alcohol dehydrogenase family)
MKLADRKALITGGNSGIGLAPAPVTIADPAPRRIRVNVVAPGATKTPVWKRGSRANATEEESAKVSDFFSSTFHLAVGASRKIWPGRYSFLPRTIRHPSTPSS